MTWWPTLGWRRLAPTTATVRASSNRPTDRAAARCSRASIAALDRSVGSMASSTLTAPSSHRWTTSKPASRKTWIMRRLLGRVSATKRLMPRSRAAAASCSRRSVPRPRPWCASVTTKATSAALLSSSPS